MANEKEQIPDLELFPALRKLEQGFGRRQIPFVQQLEFTDCGPACLAMVLGLHGRHTSLEEVKEAAANSSRDGISAQTLLRAGEWFGLRGRGLRLDPEHFHYLPKGSILHWDFNHFVVFSRLTRKGIEIVDPAIGRRLIFTSEARAAFTGIALVFETTDHFQTLGRGSGRFRWYLSQASTQCHLLWRIVLVSLLLRTFALVSPLLTALVVDRVVPRGDYSLLMVASGGLMSSLFFQFGSTLIRSHLLLQLRTNLDTRLTLGFVDYLVRLPFEFFCRRPTGDLLMRVNNNATVREILTTHSLSAFLDGLFVLAYLAIILLISPALGLLVCLLGSTQVAVYLIARRRYSDLMAQSLDTQSRSQSHLVEMFTGIETLKAAAAEQRAVEHWSNLYVDEVNASLARGRLSALVEAFIGLVRSGTPMVLVAVGASMVLNGQLTLGTMLALSALASGLITPLSTLVNTALQFQLLNGYMDRVQDVLDKEPEQTLGSRTRAPRLLGGVSVENVSFRYGDHAPFVLRDISVRIEPGSTVAIVGKSGCGKSTLASLIAGLYAPSEGRILYDGHDLSRLELKSLRRQVGIMFQQPYLFATSVRNNIALANPSIPLDQVIAAARKASIHDEIEGMPMGYDTILPDGGSSLSGGQRQRLALARALVNDPRVLILDEATSAIDGETERRVTENLSKLACTRIVLAHRLSTVVAADTILVIENGRIVETGTHAELVETQGVYGRLIFDQLAERRIQGVNHT